MRKASLALLIGLVVFVSSGCYGTRRLYRSFDDWGNQTVSNTPWASFPLLLLDGIVIGPALLVDSVIDAYYFWAQDAWDGQGTPYQHKAVELKKMSK